MNRYDLVDMSRLPPPDSVEALSFETILQEMVADYRARNPDYSAHVVESDPVMKVLETSAYRELQIRQRINEATRAVMLAYAQAHDLDHLGAFYGVARKLLVEGDETAVPPLLPQYEDDNDYRRRVQLAPEGLTTAGSDGAYIFNALTAGNVPRDIRVSSPQAGQVTITYDFNPDDVTSHIKDASVYSPAPVEVVVTVLGHEGQGIVSDEVLEAVTHHLSGRYVRPLTDQVFVQKAEILPFEVLATLTISNGPDTAVVLAEAEKRCWEYVQSQHVLGGHITQSG